MMPKEEMPPMEMGEEEEMARLLAKAGYSPRKRRSKQSSALKKRVS